MQTHIAVVIPAYRVREHICAVVNGIGPEVQAIYVIDDACPEASGDEIEMNCQDSRVRLIRNESNLGVGGATIAGYEAAARGGADVIVKIDGDGQMDPTDIFRIAAPVVDGQADYAKGNRFYNIEDLGGMPKTRLIGNMALSFMTKISTGYWQIFDPTNGFTAINAVLIKHLPLQKLARGYFFESDLLFRLNLLRCVVQDVPMKASYGTEKSSLSISREFFRFLAGHTRNTAKRLGYSYFLRGFSLASIEFALGLAALLIGLIYGTFKWITLNAAGELASSGVVMIAALPIIVGVQLLLSAINYDVQSVPRVPFSRLVSKKQANPHS